MSNDKIQLDDFNELLICVTEQTSKETEKIEIEKLKHFPNHKFKLYTGERFENMVQSVKEYGVLLPIIVWENNYEYIILSRHNRVEDCKKAGIYEIPCIIKDNLTLEEATLIVIKRNRAKYSKISRSVIEKYFNKECKQQELDNIIDKALELYFNQD